MVKQKWLNTSAGIQIPPVLYGTAWKKERTAELVVQAVQAGFRGVDTAGQPKHYDESQVGMALLKLNELGFKREELFIQTKFTPINGQDPTRIPYDANALLAQQVAQSFESSLRNLQTDYVDSLVLHSPLSTIQQTMEVWQAMEKLENSGSVKQLGISNCYDLSTLMTLHTNANVKPAVLQNRFYQATGFDKEIRRWCMEQGVIYQSFWTLTANPHLLDSDSVRTIAAKHNLTSAQVFFRYLNQKGIVPLIGTTSEQHMKEDLAIFGFDLSPEEVKLVDDLF